MTSSEEREGGVEGATRRSPLFLALAVALGGFILAALVLAWSISSGRRYQVDEIEHVHVTHLIESGKLVYRDFWEGHNPLLWVVLLPVVDADDPVGSFARSRGVAALFWIGIIAASAFAAGKAGGRWAAILTVILLLTNSTFIERGLEIRPDGPLTACVMAALAVHLTTLPLLRRFLIEALLLSAGFLFTQKGAFFCFVFGVIWLVAAIRERRPALVVIPTVLWAIPVALMIGIFAALGNLDSYLRYNVFDATRHVARGTTFGVDFDAWLFLEVEAGRNRLFVLLAAIAIAVAFLTLIAALHPRARTARNFARVSGATCAVAAMSLVYLFANPFPFPYIHVSVVPPLAVLIAVVGAFGAARLPAVAHAALWAAAGVAVVAALASADSFPRVAYESRDLNRGQMATMTEVHRITARSEPVFDLVGLHMRPDPYPIWVLTGNMLRRYAQGGFPPLIPFLRENGPVVAVMNYRTASVPPAERAFLGARFVHYTGSIYVLGTGIELEPGGVASFEALRTKPFRFEGSGRVAVDGKLFTRGILGKGAHRIEAVGGAVRGRLVMETPPPIPPPDALPKRLYTGFR